MSEPKVVLHIGFSKTGTTSIQHWLRDHEGLLSEYGVRFPRGWLRLNNHFELPLTLMRPDRMMHGRTRGDEWRDPKWRSSVLQQVYDDVQAHSNEVTILSAEVLSQLRYDDEVLPLRLLLGDAQVVAYLRNKDDYLASLAAHYCKPGMPGLSDDPEAYNHVTPDSWVADYDALLAPWRACFSRVATIDYDAVTAFEGSVIPSFLRSLGLPVTSDVFSYHLNGRTDPIPRVEGNRIANGLLFGEQIELVWPTPVAGS